MGTPQKHALLSASSAHRWLACTAAPRFEQQFEAGTSVYAEEGTLAHSVCEAYVGRKFGLISSQKFRAKMNAAQENPLYNDEMLRTAERYVEFLNEISMQYPQPPHVAVEVQVDLTDYVPEGFGTCDCIMIGTAETGEQKLHITDYKHGRGVAVSAEANPQMMLYALGALKRYFPVYSEIKTVSMAICQPRLSESASVYEIPVGELLSWGSSIVPIARKAFDGTGEFVPGEHCRFCKGRAQCAARANYFTAFQEFVGADIEGKLKPEDITRRELTKDCGEEPPRVLTDAQVAELLTAAEGLAAWYKDLQEYAMQALLNGKDLPGWKLVEGRSVRAFTDPDKAVDILLAAGYDEALIYDRKPKTLSALEKLVGRKTFNDLLAPVVEKPRGKATLAPESDKRERFNPAEAEFGGAA